MKANRSVLKNRSQQARVLKLSLQNTDLLFSQERWLANGNIRACQALYIETKAPVQIPKPKQLDGYNL